MTFDLYFFKREQEPGIAIEELISVCSSNPNVNIRQLKSGYDLFYKNKLTEVYFMMGFDSEDDGPNVPGFKRTGLTVNVNYARPTYFALEAFPVITGIAESLSLLVLDDQSGPTVQIPSKPDANALTESWIKNNKWAAGAGWSQGEKIHFVPREKLDYLWTYLTLTNTIQQVVDVFVPTKVFAYGDREGNIATCCLWPNYMPQAFPIVDLVLMGNTQSQPGNRLRGFVKLAHVRQALHGNIRDVKGPVEHLLLLDELPGKTRMKIDQISMIPTQDLKLVAWDTVVDVPPSA